MWCLLFWCVGGWLGDDFDDCCYDVVFDVRLIEVMMDVMEGVEVVVVVLMVVVWVVSVCVGGVNVNVNVDASVNVVNGDDVCVMMDDCMDDGEGE